MNRENPRRYCLPFRCCPYLHGCRSPQDENIECKIETQGSIGVENVITTEDLVGASVVVLTTDMPIKDQERFEKLPKIKVSAATVIKSASAIVAKVISELS